MTTRSSRSKKASKKPAAAPKKIRTVRRERCPPYLDALYKAVEQYVKAGGGALAVIGGVEIQQWPMERAHQFRVAVRCVGKPPTFVRATGKKHSAGRSDKAVSK